MHCFRHIQPLLKACLLFRGSSQSAWPRADMRVAVTYVLFRADFGGIRGRNALESGKSLLKVSEGRRQVILFLLVVSRPVVALAYVMAIRGVSRIGFRQPFQDGHGFYLHGDGLVVISTFGKNTTHVAIGSGETSLHIVL